MTQLKKRYPFAKFIMYQWDSIKNNKNCLRIERFFDKIFTFDMEDAQKRDGIIDHYFMLKKMFQMSQRRI